MLIKANYNQSIAEEHYHNEIKQYENYLHHYNIKVCFEKQKVANRYKKLKALPSKIKEGIQEKCNKNKDKNEKAMKRLENQVEKYKNIELDIVKPLQQKVKD